MRQRVHITVSGHVQGVWFRAYTRDTAARLDLTGFVRNLPTGDVEIVAEGEESAVEELVRWARKGPPTAHVESVQTDYSGATGEFSSFRID